MWWIVQSLYSFCYNSFLEFVFFVLVDIVAKTPLKEARSQDEKRTIWLYESLVLALLSLLVYGLDHFPYFLILLTSLTFIYTQLCGRVDFRYLWQQLTTRWEEYQQHTESMKLIRQQQQLEQSFAKAANNNNKRLQERYRLWPQQLQQNTANAFPVLNRYDANLTTNNSIWSRTKKLSLNFWKPKVNDGGEPHDMSGYNTSSTKSNRPDVGNTGNFSPVMAPVASSQRTDTPVRQGGNNWFNRNELRRRPLRSTQTGSYSPQQTFAGTSQKLKTKFMSAFGFSGHGDRPAGLKNEGQNLCFLNCVVQCLSRSPKLVQQLSGEVKQEINCSVAESALLSTLVELMSQCSAKSSASVLDPMAFRQAVSELNEGLVVRTGEKQFQQDAAEFFMWLMQAMHSVLTKRTSNEVNLESIPTLSMLKFIYGDLTSSRVQELKDACRKEISQANGLDNNSYAEPIQRLSDLEWLCYKQKNHTVIDNLFTGQLVEAYHCLTDNHLSVNMQTFNILPVPIEAPRDVSGLVFLEDCFTKFCNIEHLMGQEGLECSICNKVPGKLGTPSHPGKGQGHSYPSNKTPLMKQRMSSADSAVYSPLSTTTLMSPIPGQREFINDSGFQDNLFKTSTPVTEAVFSYPTQRLRDAQRRCLLRQLPDCLVIQLLRFTFNQYSQQSRKITAPVSIPLRNLDMTSIVYDNVTNREDLTACHSSYKYDLYGVCVHLGAEATNCGHYVCYCQGPDGTWYKFDDELVMDVNMEFEITTREIRENAYLLFYKRAPVEQSS